MLLSRIDTGSQYRVRVIPIQLERLHQVSYPMQARIFRLTNGRLYVCEYSHLRRVSSSGRCAVSPSNTPVDVSSFARISRNAIQPQNNTPRTDVTLGSLFCPSDPTQRLRSSGRPVAAGTRRQPTTELRATVFYSQSLSPHDNNPPITYTYIHYSRH